MPSFNSNKSKDYAVIGLGRFGSSLAKHLESLGHPVLGIDRDPTQVKKLATEITEAVILDATDEEALRQVDITSFSTVIVAISDNFEVNAIVTSTLKEWGLPHVISQANTDRHREILLRIGADRVILPDEESGYRLADELIMPGLISQLRLSQEYNLIEIKTPQFLVDKRLETTESFEVLVLLILRGDELIIDPDPNTVIQASDILVLVGNHKRLIEFNNLE
jgi:trk system potassium uptake protein TrkA